MSNKTNLLDLLGRGLQDEPEEAAQHDRQLQDERHADDAFQPDDYRDRLDQIREPGYEIMPSAQTGGVFNISAPVLGPDGRAIAAITCPYIQVLNVADVPTTEDVCRMIEATAQKLSELSGADIAQSGRKR